MFPRQTPNKAGPQLFPACRDREHHKNSHHTGHPVSAETSLWEEQGLKIKQGLYNKCKTKSYRYTLKHKDMSQIPQLESQILPHTISHLLVQMLNAINPKISTSLWSALPLSTAFSKAKRDFYSTVIPR